MQNVLPYIVGVADEGGIVGLLVIAAIIILICIPIARKQKERLIEAEKEAIEEAKRQREREKLEEERRKKEVEALRQENERKERIRKERMEQLQCLQSSLHPDYTVFDIETTGLNPNRDSIIEIGAVKVRYGEIIKTFSSFVNPGHPIDKYITHLTGITNSMVSTAPSIEDALKAFLDFVGDDIVVGHNVAFDISFIKKNCMTHLNYNFKNKSVDTLKISRILFPQHSHHRLSDLVSRLGISHCVDHRALSDAIQTKQCYEIMAQKCNQEIEISA